MSTFDDASLVLIPSGYKASKVYSVKPTDGTGDLTFTRSLDTATRVGPDGLIEKVRTNLMAYSEEFNDSFWTKDNGTITANSTANPLNGAVTADTWNSTSDPSFLFRSIALGAGEHTLSIFAKANANTNLRMDLITSGFAQGGSVTFNLTTGTAGAVSQFGTSTGFVANVESFGSGWFRCSLTGNIPAGTYFNQFYIGGGSVFLFGNQLETGVRTPYIPTTTAAVSVGMLANVPRLDYLGSTCGKLILEPQRTNLLLNSENYSGSNWSLGNATVTNNQAVSPDGYTNADLLKEDSTNNFHRLFDVGKTISTTTAYTSSVFVKNASGTRNFRISFGGGFGEQYVTFNVINGTIVASDNATGTIVSYGNGWYRCTATATSGAVANVNAIYWLTSGNTETYQGNGTSGVYLYGSQLEAGAYATSYIPTLGAAVTRSADAASKTGISALMPSTEGTFFIDTIVDFTAAQFTIAGSLVNTASSAFNNSAYFYIVNNTIEVSVWNTPTFTGWTQPSAAQTSGRHKMAVAWKANDFVFYLDGALVGASSSFSAVPSGLNKIDLGNYYNGYQSDQEFNQVLVFKTRLTNAQLAELTA